MSTNDDTGSTKQKSIKNYSVRNSKDTAFKYIFSNAHSLADLYRGITCNEILAEDIEHLNLDKLLQRQKRYNDTAFRTKDNRLIVFVEHMSTRSKNMPLRMLEYYVDIMRVLDAMEGKNRFAAKCIDPPKVELYVAYNGKTALDTTDKKLYVDLGAIQITVLVSDIHFDKLPKERALDTQDTLSGYAYFVKMFETKKNEGNAPYEAFIFAVSECLKKGYLTEILSRKESVDMFIERYSYDDQLLEEGEARGLLNAAMKLLKTGMGVSEISSVLELTEEQVEELEAAAV